MASAIQNLNKKAWISNNFGQNGCHFVNTIQNQTFQKSGYLN